MSEAEQIAEQWSSMLDALPMPRSFSSSPNFVCSSTKQLAKLAECTQRARDDGKSDDEANEACSKYRSKWLLCVAGYYARGEQLSYLRCRQTVGGGFAQGAKDGRCTSEWRALAARVRGALSTDTTPEPDAEHVEAARECSLSLSTPSPSSSSSAPATSLSFHSEASHRRQALACSLPRVCADEYGAVEQCFVATGSRDLKKCLREAERMTLCYADFTRRVQAQQMRKFANSE